MKQNKKAKRHLAAQLPIFLILLLVLLGPNRPADAQNRQQLASECLNLLDNNQTQQAAEIASEIQLWKTLFGTNVIASAEECLSRSTGEHWKYFTSEGGFLSGDEALSQQAFIDGAQERREKKERDLEVLECRVILLEDNVAYLEQQLERVNAERFLENNLATWSVCVSRHEADREAALLEPVCNNLFATNGLPDSESNFDYIKLQKVRISLLQAKARLVEFQLPGARLETSESKIVEECKSVLQ